MKLFCEKTDSNRVSIAFIFSSFFFSLLFAQTEQWVYRYDGPANDDDRAYSIVYGIDGNLYAAGISRGVGTLYDIAVVSVDALGNERWVYRYSGEGNDRDDTHSIIYGLDNNVYIAGYTVGNGTSYDFTIISLDTLGNERWVYHYREAGTNWEGAHSVVYGLDGNIYAAGYCYGSGTSSDFAVISLDSAGNERWVYKYNGPGNDYDRANVIAYGLDDNLYIGGTSTETSRDFTIVSVDTSGNERWAYRYNGAADSTDDVKSIVCGLDGNIYAGGFTCGIGTFYDFTVISIDTSGTERWVYHQNGPADTTDEVNSLTYGFNDNIYAAGYIYTDNAYSDLIVVGLDTAGNEQWLYNYDGPMSGYDEAYSIIHGLDSNIYVAGHSVGLGTSHDYIVTNLTTSGNEQWIYRYSLLYDDYAYSVVYGPDGYVYSAGTCAGDNITRHDYLIICLDPTIGIREKKVTTVGSNCFSPTIICGALLQLEDKNCKIFDISGRKIHTLNPVPGIYFIEVDGVISQKVIKLK